MKNLERLQAAFYDDAGNIRIDRNTYAAISAAGFEAEWDEIFDRSFSDEEAAVEFLSLVRSQTLAPA
jgi:hypothetical protein